MTKIKGSIWSKVFSVFVSLAFVFTLFTSVTNLTAKAATSEYADEFNACIVGIKTEDASAAESFYDKATDT